MATKYNVHVRLTQEELREVQLAAAIDRRSIAAWAAQTLAVAAKKRIAKKPSPAA